MIKKTLKKKALLIGADHYMRLPRLRYAENDATASAESLKKNYGFRDDEIVLTTCGGSGVKLFPILRNIRRQLFELCSESPDFLFIGFWGHGFRGANGRRYLCLADTDPDDLRHTSLPLELVMDLVGEIGASTSVLVLDCSQNMTEDRFFKRTLSSRSIDDSLQERVSRTGCESALRRLREGGREEPTVTLLSSCAPGRHAYESPEFEHGWFTHFLLEAFERRFETVNECFDYVSERMKGSGKPWNDQRPEIYSYGKAARFPSLEEESELYGALCRFRYDLADAATERAELPESVLRSASAARLAEKICAEMARARARSGGTPKSLTILDVEYRFRWIPEGAFMMGNEPSEKDREPDETLHRVTFSRGFWMLETPVTQRMWRSVMGNNPSAFSSQGENAGKVKGIDTADFPVENVNWDDCQIFCNKLQTLLKLSAENEAVFRLPTESEWEYACRAGGRSVFSGSENLDEVAWYYDNCGERTHEAAQKKPNAWGLYDMCGNVWEWCGDWYGAYPNGSLRDPQGPSCGSFRVLRGGGWFYDAADCRAVNRAHDLPEVRDDNIGFRIVMEDGAR